MSARTLVLFSSIALSSVASFACSSDDPGTDGTGGSPGSGGSQASGGSSSGGGSGSDTCEVDPDPSAAAVSFKTNVMPIFGFACSGSACHTSGKKAGLYLGPKCEFDAATKGCIFPTTANPDKPDGPQPLTDAQVLEVYNNLMVNSQTAAAVKRIVKGDPDASFLVDKIAGLQNDKGLSCVNTDPGSATSGPCGDPMPLVGGPLCKTGSTAQATRVDVIVNWVAQGAENN